VVGVCFYFFFRLKTPTPILGKEIGAKFSAIDLLLIWFPLTFFLINPIILYLYPSAAREPAETSTLVQLGGIFLQFIYFAFIGVITMLLIQHVSLRSFSDLLGLRQMRWVEIISWALVGTVLSLLICTWVLGNCSTIFLTEKLGDLDMQKPVEELKNAKSFIVKVFSIILACFAAPLVEETLFRGYFYGVLKKFTSPVFSGLITSALFAVVHVNLPALVPLWGFAIILTIAYEATRCLWVPILIHALFNTANVILLIIGESKS
jgi:uncharacterized protein